MLNFRPKLTAIGTFVRPGCARVRCPHHDESSIAVIICEFLLVAVSIYCKRLRLVFVLNVNTPASGCPAKSTSAVFANQDAEQDTSQLRQAQYLRQSFQKALPCKKQERSSHSGMSQRDKFSWVC